MYSGDSIRHAVAAASSGDTIVVHGGSYSEVKLTRRFAPAVRIVGAPGESVTVAGFVISGGAGYVVRGLHTNGESRLQNGAHDVTFDHVRCSIPTGDTSSSCFYFHDNSHDAVVANSYASGGWDGVKLYGCDGSSWANNITVRDSEITAANEDLIHVNCANNVTIKHNWLHDPVDTDDHNDGVQTQASGNLRIVRNTFSWTSVPAQGGPNQAMILGNAPAQWPDRQVINTLVANNLVQHWNGGRPLIMNGTVNTRIVNNTFMDSGDAALNDPSITVANQGSDGGQNPGLQIWNNILKSVDYEPGSTHPSFFSTNLITDPIAGITGADALTGDPEFVDRTLYALAAGSAANGRALIRVGTPRLDIDGRKRRLPPSLGARG